MWILVAAACLFLASASHADDILVPGDYQTIQEGIDAADFHDRVLVGPGTWSERITLRDSVHVMSTDGAEVTIIDAEMQGRAVVADSVAAVFNGFTITNGMSPTNGAGMNVTGYGYEMLIHNCIFVGNEATGQGGGLAVQNATAVIGDCVFTGNSAAGGAGIYVYGNLVTPVRIENCEVESNTSTGPGGGVFVEAGSCVLMTVGIHDNTTTGLGGGMACDDAAADIGGCAIYSNSGQDGGGISYHNSSLGTVSWCTLYDNDAPTGAGISCTNDSSPTIARTIIAASTGAGTGLNCGVGSTPLVECSNIWGNAGGDAICGTDNGDNISLDPLFCRVDPLAEGNFAIQSISPCTPDSSLCSLRIGAGSIECGTSPTEPTSWGRIKSSYR